MSEKPASATSDLQARAFNPARRRVVLADLTGRDGLFGELIVARLEVLSHFTFVWARSFFSEVESEPRYIIFIRFVFSEVKRQVCVIH
jgi:hypothetical protein